MSEPTETSQSLREEPFEALLDRLRGVVEELEQGELPLEESLARFEEGVTLSRLAASKLESAERRVDALIEEGGALKLVPFPSVEGAEGGEGR